MTCIFVSAGTASFTAPPWNLVDYNSFSRSYLFVALVIALDLGHKTSCLIFTCQGCLLGPSIRSTLHPSGRCASARLDSVGSWPDLRLVLSFMIICILKACVAILLYLMRTVNGDTSNGTCPRGLPHPEPSPHDLYARDPSHRSPFPRYALARKRGLQSRIIVNFLGGACQLRHGQVGIVAAGLGRPGIVRGAYCRGPAPAPWRACRCHEIEKSFVRFMGCPVTHGHSKQGKYKAVSQRHFKINKKDVPSTLVSALVFIPINNEQLLCFRRACALVITPR